MLSLNWRSQNVLQQHSCSKLLFELDFFQALQSDLLNNEIKNLKKDASHLKFV